MGSSGSGSSGLTGRIKITVIQSMGRARTASGVQPWRRRVWHPTAPSTPTALARRSYGIPTALLASSGGHGGVRGKSGRGLLGRSHRKRRRGVMACAAFTSPTTTPTTTRTTTRISWGADWGARGKCRSRPSLSSTLRIRFAPVLSLRLTWRFRDARGVPFFGVRRKRS